MMYSKLSQYVAARLAEFSVISPERQQVLAGLTAYIQSKKDKNLPIRLNMICTHNSRRSHLSQVWAQLSASRFGIRDTCVYSGGTEATAMYPMIRETLTEVGFELNCIAEAINPIYTVSFDENEPPLVCFSKTYDHSFNPQSDYAAVMTCNHADQNCPIIRGAVRISVPFEDPKKFDDSPLKKEKYLERCDQIAREMLFVFSRVK